MIAKSKLKNNKFFKQHFPYILALVALLGLVFWGSESKISGNKEQASPVALSQNDFSVSVDQVSKLYIMANLADSLSFASAETIASDYVIANTMYRAGQTSLDKLEKPNIIFSSSRGVITHVVAAGESLDSIAAKYGLTPDQVRWSNGLKNANISVGATLYLPSTPGIVYLTKAGETPESIAAKYGSSATEIIALNDLELSGLSEGVRIVIKNGTLPNTERPEYVAPVRRYTYSYLGDTSERRGITVIGYNYAGGGQCVGYATWYREQIGRPIPWKGNANRWDDHARAAGFLVNKTPAIGAVFQTDSGRVGHVGVVVGINGDGSIVVREANYGHRVGRITESTIPASIVQNFWYIH